MMTILEFKTYFKTELSAIYTEAESAELYSIFIQQIVGFSKFQQNQFANQSLSESQMNDLQNAIHQLKTGKPYQHILGEAEFYGSSFFVSSDVLIPRPETEELLEFAINTIQKSELKNEKLRIVDIGTGSGIIPIILKKHFPNAEISAIDVSGKALEMAKKNATLHKTEIRFIKKDFLNEDLNERFDIIISNPPYIGIDEKTQIHDSIKSFEPEIALFSPTEDTLIFYKKIAEFAQQSLTQNGMVFLEINQKLGSETLALFQNFREKQMLKDISGNDRIVFAKL